MGRKKARTPKQKREAFEERKGKGIQAGKSGRGVGEYICWLFEFNERLPAEQKLTDDKIQAMLLDEFPNRNSDYFYRINAIRNRYNRGIYSNGVPPQIKSNRYNVNGDIIDAWGRTVADLERQLIGECNVCGFKVKSATEAGIERLLTLHGRQHVEERKGKIPLPTPATPNRRKYTGKQGGKFNG